MQHYAIGSKLLLAKILAVLSCMCHVIPFRTIYNTVYVHNFLYIFVLLFIKANPPPLLVRSIQGEGSLLNAVRFMRFANHRQI